MKKPDYFAEGFKADNIARDLRQTKEKKSHNPNQKFLEKALENIEIMELFDKTPETNFKKLPERIFYTKLLFQDYEEDTTWNIKRKLKNYSNTKNLVKESLAYSGKTIEKLLKGKTPSTQALEQTEELFDYIADECLKNIQKQNSLFQRKKQDLLKKFKSDSYSPGIRIQLISLKNNNIY